MDRAVGPEDKALAIAFAINVIVEGNATVSSNSDRSSLHKTLTILIALDRVASVVFVPCFEGSSIGTSLEFLHVKFIEKTDHSASFIFIEEVRFNSVDQIVSNVHCIFGLNSCRLLLLLGLRCSLSSSSLSFRDFLILISFLPRFTIKEIFDTIFVIGNKLYAMHVRLKNLGNSESLLCLVVFDNAAHCSLSGTHGTIEHVNVEFVFVVMELIRSLKVVAAFESSRLIVSAVRAGDKFTPIIVAREPSFKVVFGRGSVIELSRNNVDNAVRKFESLIEGLRSFNQLLELFPTVLRLAVNELLDLFELVDAENTPDITPVRSSFLSKTSRDTSIFLRKLGRFEPLFHVKSRNGLFRSSCEIHMVFSILLDDLV